MSRTCRRRPIEPIERRTEIVEHDCKTAVKGGATADQHIITMRSHRHDIEALHQLAEPAADAVALGRGTVFPGHGEADPDRAGVVAAAVLDHEAGLVDPRAIGSSEEVRPLP